MVHGQLGDVTLECRADLAQDRERQVPLPTFNPPNIRPVYLGGARKILLSPPHRFTLFADARSKLLKYVITHVRILSKYGL